MKTWPLIDKYILGGDTSHVPFRPWLEGLIVFVILSLCGLAMWMA